MFKCSAAVLFIRLEIFPIMDHKIDFLSLNVGMSSTLSGLSTIITTQSLDVIFLQEVRLSNEQIELQL